MCFIPFRFVKPILSFAAVLILFSGIGMVVLAGLSAANAFYQYIEMAWPMFGVCLVIGIIMVAFSALLINGLQVQKPGRVCLALSCIFFCIMGIISLIGVVFTVRNNYTPIY